MMMHEFGDAVVTVECPECSSQIKQTAAHLRAHPLRCADCSSTFRVDGEQLRAALAQFARAYQARLANGPFEAHKPLESFPGRVTH